MNIQEAEKYINNIPRFADKTEPENVRRLMQILGNPERKSKTVHIAGTNGKGSVAKMMSLFLDESGFKTGLFLSPHIEKINERISINERDISDEDFGRIFDIVKNASDELVSQGGSHPAYFEFLFAMGAVYFAEQECDYVVYETGLGGRLDATNCIMPCMTAITEIGLDHVKYLGDTVEKIAEEKAGIIKKGVPLIYFTGRIAANKVIEFIARERGCPAFNAAWTDISVKSSDGGKIDFSLDNRYYTYDNLVINFGSLYQTRNAATAVYMFDRLFNEKSIEEKQSIIQHGLARFRMKARFQYLKDNIVLDGAHNEDAAKELTQSLRKSFKNFSKIRKKIVFAISSDKDYEKVLDELCYGIRPSEIYITELSSGRKLDKQILYDMFSEKMKDKAEIRIYENCEDAYNAAVEGLKEDELLIITGSLYLAGEVLQYIGNRD